MPTGFRMSENVGIQATRGRSIFLSPQSVSEAGKGSVRTTPQWTDKLEHPGNMLKYDEWSNDPETRIGIDLLAAMTVGNGYYVEMPEKDEAGKNIDPDHPNKKIVEDWLKKINADGKFKEVERMKLSRGFCPVERLDDGTIKVLPPETFYIHRKEDGTFIKYTQEIIGASNREREWTENQIVLFALDEDTAHPYGHSLVDSIGELIDARQSMNRDMPKIIHRFASPLGVWETDREISQLYAAVLGRNVDEEIFIGNVPKDSIRHTYYEPNAQGKFQTYIEQINFQIAENLHAPLILLLRNANLASSKIMMDSVELFTRAEQRYNSIMWQENFFKQLCGDGPVPELKWGAPKAVFDDITLMEIGGLQANRTITQAQAQDLIRQKGIPLLEVEEPQPMVGPQGLPSPFQFRQAGPMNLVEPQKITQLQASLNVVRDAFKHKQVTLSEAIREGSQILAVMIEKLKFEALEQMNRVLPKPIVQLSPEATRMFELLRTELFDQYRESLLPTGVRVKQETSYTVIPNAPDNS
jgi:hypothetical protein